MNPVVQPVLIDVDIAETMQDMRIERTNGITSAL